MQPKQREIKGKLGDLIVTNTEVYCEVSGEWFNTVNCRIEICKDGNSWLEFPNGIVIGWK